MLKQFPESFFYEILSQGSFIVDCLLALIESVENYINLMPPIFYFLDEKESIKIKQNFIKYQKRVGKRALSLKKLLIDRFGYNLDQVQIEQEEGEEAPVLVDNPYNFYTF